MFFGNKIFKIFNLGFIFLIPQFQSKNYIIICLNQTSFFPLELINDFIKMISNQLQLINLNII